jgi:hypothetical protein
VNYLDIPYEAVKIFEPQVLKACVTEYQNPNNVPPGEIRAIPKKHQLTGTVERIDFVGRESFVKAMSIPGRRMSIFNERTREWYPPRR